MPRDELKSMLVELFVVLLIGMGVGLVGGWSLAVAVVGPKPTMVNTGVRDTPGVCLSRSGRHIWLWGPGYENCNDPDIRVTNGGQP